VSAHSPLLLAVSVGRAVPLFEVEGGPAGDASGRPPPRAGGPLSAIRKVPVSTLDDRHPIAVRTSGVAGDEQADPSVHGGVDKAVYVYPAEHYPFWRDALTRAGVSLPLGFGAMGENLTVEALSEQGVWVGDRLEIGDVELLVTQPRQPCFKFNARMHYNGASRTMVQSGYTGFYCEVTRPGILSAGAEIRLHPGRRSLTIEQLHRLKHRRQRDLFE
jgi:MOSC domain-containing protein YiiM